MKPTQPTEINVNLISSSIFATLMFFAQVAVGLCLLMFAMHYFRPTQQYYTRDPQGQKNLLASLDRPNVTADSLIKWATLVATQIHTTDFANYDTNLKNISSSFTKDGYQSFLDILEQNDVEEAVKSKRIRITSIAINQAVILLESPDSWIIQVPLLITYQGMSQSSTQKYVASNLYVINVPTDQAKTGIGVNKLIENSDYNIQGMR
jgi:hypothetical protein